MTRFDEFGTAIRTWGYGSPETTKKLIDDRIMEWIKVNDPRVQTSLLAAILTQLETLTVAVSQIPKAIDRIPTAETIPPAVTVIQMQREDIERAVNNGRVLRRF